MKNTLLILLLLMTGNLYAQSIHNMRLLKNVNQHAAAGDYSACWGYTAPNGREYAILGCWDGTAFIDITDTSNIREVDFVPTPTPVANQGNNWREMKCYSHYCYIVSEADTSQIQIVDLQYLPDSVHLIKKFKFPNYSTTHSISQSGPYLYLNGTNLFNGGLIVLDLTADPENPIVRGKWNSFYVHDSRIINDTIYTTHINNNHISIINAANKDSLKTITSWVNTPNPLPHNIAITTGSRYAYTTDETNNPPGRLKIWDIRDKSNITFVASWNPTNITNSMVHNVEIYGNTAVVAHSSAGIRMLDITNPASPVEVAWYDTYPLHNNTGYLGCWGVYMFPSGKIIGSDQQTGLYVVRPTVIVGVETLSFETPVSFKLSQNYPNPFNPSTNINYQLPEAGFVKLSVYDISGRIITTLVDQKQNAGTYSAAFDGAELASGVYFYKLEAGTFTEVKRMILQK